MQINQITVGWSETCSLPGYDNVKPSITLTATLTDEDKPVEYFIKLLMEQAQEYVRELINQAQELAGEYPKYYDGPRFVLLYSSPRKAFIITAKNDKNWPDDFIGTMWSGRKSFLLPKAAEMSKNRMNGWQSFDCTDGDYSKLPPLPEPEPQPTPYPEDIPF